MKYSPELPLVVLNGEPESAYLSELLSQGSAVLVIPGSNAGAEPLQANGASSEDRSQLTIDLISHQAFWEQNPLPLTEQELHLLAALARKAGAAVSRLDLSAAVWNDAFFVSPEAVISAVKRLRRKMDAAGTTTKIESVRGYGYRLSDESQVSVRP